MKVHELTVGDFVYFCCFDGSKIVVHVTGFKDGIVYGDSKDGKHWCNIENVEAVRITPEILENNEFKKELDDDSIHVRYTIIADGISFSLKYALSVYQWFGPLDFKYVHELQHALRLCRIEKEIIL